MTKYINEETLRKLMYEEAFEKDSDMQKWDSGCWIRYKLFENCLEAVPPADVVEVRHGRWGIVESWKRKSVYRCSECGNFLTVRPDTLNGGRGDMNYCPNCGAVMDGGQDDG